MVERTFDESRRRSVGALAEQYPAIKLVYLFGSRARGETGPTSDYDFAVYIDDAGPAALDAYLSFVARLPKAVQSENIDVVPLRTADRPELCYRIISEGLLVYEVSPYRLIVEPKIVTEYFDFKLSQTTHFAE